MADLDFSGSVEIHFHQQREASVFIESSEQGDRAIFVDAALFAALAIRVLSNLGNCEESGILASALSDVGKGAKPPETGVTYGDVLIVPYAGSPGRKWFKATIRMKPAQFVTKVESSGFGWFNVGYGAYAPISVLTLLTYLMRRESTKLATQLCMLSVCPAIVDLYREGRLTPFANHHELTLLAVESLSPWLADKNDSMLDAIAYAGIEWCKTCGHYSHHWISENRNVTPKSYHLVCEQCNWGSPLTEEQKNEALREIVGIPSKEQCRTIWNALRAAFDKASIGKKTEQDKRTAEAYAVQSVATELAKTESADHIRYVTDRFVNFMTGTDPTKPQ